jgi:two-component system phosphate regulon sensor histidine kinase PhoR
MSHRRLLWQIYPAYLLIVVTALAVITVYLSQLLPEFYNNQIADDLRARAGLVKQQILPVLKEPNFVGIDELSKILGRSGSTRITVILPDGRVIADSEEDAEKMENHGNRPEIKDALEKGMGRSLRFSSTLGEEMMYLAIPIEDRGKLWPLCGRPSRQPQSIESLRKYIKEFS